MLVFLLPRRTCCKFWQVLHDTSNRENSMQKVSNVKGLSDAKVDKILAAAAALAPISGWTNALTLTHKVMPV